MTIQPKVAFCLNVQQFEARLIASRLAERRQCRKYSLEKIGPVQTSPLDGMSQVPNEVLNISWHAALMFLRHVAMRSEVGPPNPEALRVGPPHSAIFLIVSLREFNTGNRTFGSSISAFEPRDRRISSNASHAVFAAASISAINA
jgi:hypothetical protein